MATVLLGTFNSALYTLSGSPALTMQERHYRPVTVCIRRYACPDQGSEHEMSGRGSLPERKLLVSRTVAGNDPIPRYPWRGTVL